VAIAVAVCNYNLFKSKRAARPILEQL